MKRLLREPLLHFLLLGAALFVVYGNRSGSNATAPDTIVVTQGQISSLASQFNRTWQRPPSKEELSGLIRAYVREEVLYREGLALGLDRDDPIIRRRVGQKLKFVAENTEVPEPSEQDLQTYLDAHLAAFTVQPRFNFRQIYLDPRRRERSIPVDAERLLDELNRTDSKQDPTDLGDATLLPFNFENASASEVERVLGGEFATTLATLSTGPWQGPVSSGFGAHLVQVSERIEARSPPLAEVRDTVKRDWLHERRSAANENFYQTLLSRYIVTIEEATPVKITSDPDRPLQQ